VPPPSQWELQPIRLPLQFVVKEDFTGGTIRDPVTRRQWTVAALFDARVRELVHDWSPSSPELIDEMIVTALKIARDQLSVADLKLINRSVKEMRYAAKVFAPFQRFRKVAVFGSARTSPSAPEFISKEDFSFSKSPTTSEKRFGKSCSFIKSITLPVGSAKNLSFELVILYLKKALPILTRDFRTRCEPARSSKALHCARKKTSPRFGIYRD
jgi:hypothetical protein